MKKQSLTRRILIAMFLGIFFGSLINLFASDSFLQHYFIDGICFVIGQLYVNSLKMMVVPLVFVSLVNGIISLADISSLGRMASKTILLYISTTALAISIALMVALIIQPGQNSDISTTTAEFTTKQAPSISETIINMVPSNPIEAMASAEMLQIIFFAILFGLAISLIKDKSRPVIDFFQALDQVVMKMVEIIMCLAPYGVFALIATTFANQGFDLIKQLLAYFLATILALFIHASMSYSALLLFFAKINPLVFFKKIREVMLFAFSTASSGATIPVTLRVLETKLGVKNSVASFSVPLGATINMDGTAIMQGVATVFIAQVYAVDLTLTDYLMVILTATLASVGTAGVPGVGLITLALVLEQVGLPVEGIGLIIGIDRLLDMIRTAVNVTGDCAVTCVIAKTEKALNPI